MKKTSLQEQTSDPRWQRKRLEILERDKWTCKQCGDTETTLTVHHKSYRMVDGKFVDYWDYEDRHLITLCKHCHEQEEYILKCLGLNTFFFLKDTFEDARSLYTFLHIAQGVYNVKKQRIDYDKVKNLHDYAMRCEDES